MKMHLSFVRRAAPVVALSILAATASAQPPGAAEARAIAKKAYVYGFPMVDSYRIQYAYNVDRSGPEFKAPWNEIASTARVFTPADTTIQTPNSDTPYSFIGMDLRAEPIVLTIPPIEKGRYFSVQLIDAYTFNFAYLGSRATGNGGGTYMVAGPGWKGGKPAGIDAVIRSETQLINAIYRTQLFGPDDLEKVKKIQAGYKAQPLSAFLGKPAPAAAPALAFPKPLGAQDERSSPELFSTLNFILGLSPVNPSEKALMARFAKLGIGPGQRFDFAALSPELKQAVRDGIADAWKSNEATKQRLDTHQISSGDLFGTRAFLKNNYQYRMTAAVAGIYGNSKDEAIYPVLALDSKGRRLDGSHAYTLRFAPGQLPPVHAFWSVTMYRMPESLLVANPIHRYLVNSPMLPQLKKDADGGVTLHLQNASPGAERESNWLPAPSGPFVAAMRLYWPKQEALNGKWKAPQLQRVD
ncbi:DUF1254 domain-containing protein [Variovorax sp. J22P168]|uniref:DUF1254 domain-containing protein n=1 Tax=Variovorax jilinensis TaxID=3053513 RepID=UPI002577A651|nr:DUF1254 domain-containing protein [Variovorax sp. J22P168]MDM0011693.1 DUF1254 domain-containing protein [Variovorax sp. J22P168]